MAIIVITVTGIICTTVVSSVTAVRR